jgi:hypothetical protein
MTSPAATAPTSASVWEDFVDIFYAPREVFERRRDGRFGIALAILIGLMALLLYLTRPLLAPVYDAIVDQGVAQARAANPQLPPDAVQQMRDMSDRFLLPGLIFNFAIAVPLAGAVLWVVGKLFDSRQTVGQAMMVATYANVPRFVLGTITSALLALALGPESLNSPYDATMSLARLAPDGTSPLLLAALSRLDLFVLWATALLGVGLAVTGGIKRSSAFLAAAAVWLIATLATVAGAARAA